MSWGTGGESKQQVGLSASIPMYPEPSGFFPDFTVRFDIVRDIPALLGSDLAQRKWLAPIMQRMCLCGSDAPCDLTAGLSQWLPQP